VGTVESSDMLRRASSSGSHRSHTNWRHRSSGSGLGSPVLESLSSPVDSDEDNVAGRGRDDSGDASTLHRYNSIGAMMGAAAASLSPDLVEKDPQSGQSGSE